MAKMTATLMWPCVTITSGMFVAAVWIFRVYQRRAEKYSRGEVFAPDSTKDAAKRTMDRTRYSTIACALLWPVPAVVALTLRGPDTVHWIVTEFTAGAIGTLGAGAFLYLVKPFTEKFWTDEFTPRRFAGFSFTGAAASWLVTAVHVAWTEPGVRKALIDAVPEAVKKLTGGG
ncbi:MAG TPA: hypothetical protein VN822_02385 [Candidatus Acidoferrales bacterium]|nr:hypothetical protein [Candidatus Acidoferrales bacterium]